MTGTPPSPSSRKRQASPSPRHFASQYEERRLMTQFKQTEAHIQQIKQKLANEALSENRRSQKPPHLTDLYNAMNVEPSEGDIMLQRLPRRPDNEMRVSSPPHARMSQRHAQESMMHFVSQKYGEGAQHSSHPRSPHSPPFSGATQEIRFMTRPGRDGSTHQIIQMERGYAYSSPPRRPEEMESTTIHSPRQQRSRTPQANGSESPRRHSTQHARNEAPSPPHMNRLNLSSHARRQSPSPSRRTSHSTPNSARHKSPAANGSSSPRLRQTPHSARASSPRAPNSARGSSTSPRPHSSQKDLVHASYSRNIIHYSPKDTIEDRLLKSHLSKQMRQTEKIRSKNIDTRREPALHSSQTQRPHQLSSSERHLNQLLQKKQEYEEKRERKKNELERKEKEKFTGKPKINKRSQQMVNGRQGEIFNRLYEQRQEIVAKRERRKIESKQAEEEFNFRPSINPTSAELRRNDTEERVDTMLHWEEERKKKLETLRKAKEEQDQMDFKPKINPLSDKLAKVKKNRTAMRVEDRLLQYREQKLYEKEERVWELEREVIERANPKINLTSPVTRPHQKVTSRMREQQMYGTGAMDEIDDPSMGADEDVDVFDRLYSKAAEYEYKRRSKKLDRERAAAVDQRTGQPMFSPMINARSAAMIRHLPVEDILQMKGETKKQKLERLILEEKRRLKSQVSEKKVSAYSELLSILKEQRDGEDATQRLMRPIQNISDFTIQQLQAQQQEVTLKPKINERSKRIDMQKNGADEESANGGASPRYRFEHLLKKKDEYEAKRLRLQEHLLSEQLQECSFQPRQLSQPPPSSRVSTRGDQLHSPYATKKHQRAMAAEAENDVISQQNLSEEILMYYQ